MSLQHWLTHLILEICKQDGSPFPPNSLHHITAGLMRYLRWNSKPEIDIFRFHVVLGVTRCRNEEAIGQGVDTRKKQAQILIEEDEEFLWTKGLLADSTPQFLLDMLIFYNGLFFALGSGRSIGNYAAHSVK